MVDAGLALLIIVIVFGAFLILRSIKNFIINAIVGLVILFWPMPLLGLALAIAGRSC